MTVGLTFDYFSGEKVDIAVVETGLGGRLDSTNVITPLLSVITNISLDHQILLGHTLEKIAVEKAGIIKAGIPVVIGETQKEVAGVFVGKSESLKSPLFFADQKYKVVQSVHSKKILLDISSGNKTYKVLECGLAGHYQKKNVCTVLVAIDVLTEKGFTISESHIRKGISRVVKQTELMGRWQILSRKPLTIADIGHNEAGIREVLKQIKLTPYKKLHFVLGMVNDKDIRKILKLLPRNAIYYFCRANIPRALGQYELASEAQKCGLKGNTYPSVKKALKAARSSAFVKDMVFVGGSTFVVAEVI